MPPVLSFTMDSINGKPIDLSKYQGRVVLMVNVASQCGYTPQYEGLEELHKKYAAKGLQILGVTYESEKPAMVRRIALKYKINYPLLFGSEELAKQYHVEEALPTTIIVDREGKIQSQILGMIDTKDVEEKIAPLLAANGKQ